MVFSQILIQSSKEVLYGYIPILTRIFNYLMDSYNIYGKKTILTAFILFYAIYEYVSYYFTQLILINLLTILVRCIHNYMDIIFLENFNQNVRPYNISPVVNTSTNIHSENENNENNIDDNIDDNIDSNKDDGNQEEDIIDNLPDIRFKKKLQLKNDTCTICLCKYKKNEKITILPCFHLYHSKCIKKSLKRCSHNCPICRSNVCELIKNGKEFT